MLLTLLAFGVMVGVLIFVHELGHFVAAKGLGVQVHRFSLGFGKTLVSFRRGETEYVIAAIPLGGYVKMAGLEDEAMEKLEGPTSDPVDPARAFDRKPIWVRLVILSAGVTMNVLLAYCIYVARATTVGLPAIATTTIDTVRAGDLPTAAAALGTIRPGDRVLRINGDTVRNWSDIDSAVIRGQNPARFEIAGREPLVVPLGNGSDSDRFKVLGALLWLQPARVGLVEPGRPGYRAGLRPGDLVIRVNGDTVRSWFSLVRRIRGSPGQPLRLDALRGDSVMHLAVTPETHADTTGTPPRVEVYGQLGVSPNPFVVHVREPMGRALVDGGKVTAGGLVLIVGVVKRLVVGQLSLRKTLSGPPEIAVLSGQAVRLGYDTFLDQLMAFSLTLAVLNFLPIPILDGGQVAFVLAEAVRRKPLSLNVRLRLSQIGFVFLMALMLFAIVNGAFKFVGH